MYVQVCMSAVHMRLALHKAICLHKLCKTELEQIVTTIATLAHAYYQQSEFCAIQQTFHASMATSKYTCVEDADVQAPLLKPFDHSEGKCLVIFRNIAQKLMQSSIVVAILKVCKSVGGVVMKDTAKTIHSLKMAFALLMAFLLVLLRAPYEQLGENTIWAIMTVIVVFEFTIGATLSKGLNRGVGTLLAALLAIGVGELAECMSGGVGYPISVGFSVFLIGGVVTFGMVWPALKSYEYGFRTFLLTFSLIMVAEYRGDDPLGTAINRFFVILLGAAIGISVNVFLLPCWAGHDLHLSVIANFHGVADSLEACVNEYLCGTVRERFPSNVLMEKIVVDPLYDGYKSTLASASKEETLAGFASWEPPHGQFKVVKYPWYQYVKVGSVLRHCAYSVVALHGCLQSTIQAPVGVRKLFENEIRAVGIECALVLRKLGSQIEDMQKGESAALLLQGLECAIDQLQGSLYFRSYLLMHGEEARDSEQRRENISVSVVPEVSRLTHDNAQESNILTQTRSSDDLESARAHQQISGSLKKCINKMHSWPSRRKDDLDFAKEPLLEQKVRVLESASALSMGTFASLLMEVAHRLDYVVEAVHELGELAGFADLKDVEHADVDIQGSGFHDQAIVAGWQRY